jgi:transketolase
MQLQFAPLDVYRMADALPKWKRLACYAALNRFNALYAIQRAGAGHIGGSFSSADIITYMHLEHPEIAFFSSKGHDCPLFYASLVATGALPLEMLAKLRRVGGLPGHPELGTPGIVAHSGSLGMGISKAKGLIRANRLRGIKQRVAVLLGDGELQEGQVWESLIDCDLRELTVIIDCNLLSTEARPHFGGPSLLTKLYGFGRVAGFNGHRFLDMEGILRVDEPLIIMAGTIKGKGVSFMEGKSQYHSGALTTDEYNAAVSELWATIQGYLPDARTCIDCRPKRERQPNALIAAYEAALWNLAADQRVVVLDADLAADCGLTRFRELCPSRFIECGIAEQDMVSQAGMLAAQGFVPLVHSFAAFLTRRANEQIYDNCHQELRVVYVGAMAGRLPDGPGPTHEALADVALMRTMPGMEILEPRTPADVDKALHYTVNQAEGPVYLRLVANDVERMRRE